MTGQGSQTLQIDLGERSYPIVIGAGLLDDAALVTSHVTARDVLVVTNTRSVCCTPRLLASLLAARAGSTFDGEQHRRCPCSSACSMR
jgi:3-dehydroquinate synthase